MQIKINRTSRFSGTVQIPPDKSITHRAVLLSSLAQGTSVVTNPLEAEDCLSTLSCIEALGCGVQKKKGNWTIEGRGLWGYKPPSASLDCGNSGTTMRLLSGILAAQDFESVLTGDASLSKRPMDRIAAPLDAMGAQFQLREGKYAPFRLKGTRALKPVHWKSPVASAQVKSCVLLAGLHAKGETSFEEPSLSRDHTERMLKACGVALKQQGTIVSVHGPALLKPQEWTVPADMSSAAFFLVAGLLVEGASVALKSVNTNPTRTGLLDVLRKMGAQVGQKNEGDQNGEPIADLEVKGGAALQAISLEEKELPRLIDEIPILAVAATQAEGTTYLRGLSELKVKETDRMAAVAANLKTMGAHVKEEDAGLVIEGPTPLHGASIDSFGDHRIAMAFAVAGLIASGETTIRGSECVSISYPAFWESLSFLCRG